MHFENNASYIELRKIVEIEFYYSVVWKKNFFFGSFEESKVHQLCKLVTDKMSKYTQSKRSKGALKVVPIFAT